MTLKVDGTNGVLQAYDYQVLTTGFSYTFAAGTQLLLAVPAGTLATGTVTMPASPADGMNITISSTQQITALTVNANTGQSIVGGTISIKAGGSQTFVYRLANTTWYNQSNTAANYSGPNSQVFTSTGTFTVPAGITQLKVACVGGGGGGSGGYIQGCNIGNGGIGGKGGNGLALITGLTPGATITVTVGGGGNGTAGNTNATGGTGGTTTFGTYATATGGTGGNTNTSSLATNGIAGSFSTTGTVLARSGFNNNGNTAADGFSQVWAGSGQVGGAGGGGGGGGISGGGAGSPMTGTRYGGFGNLGSNGANANANAAGGAGGGTGGGSGGAFGTYGGGGGGGAGGVVVYW